MEDSATNATASTIVLVKQEPQEGHLPELAQNSMPELQCFKTEQQKEEEVQQQQVQPHQQQAQQQEDEQLQQPQHQLDPLYLKFIDELGSLSDAINVFKCRYKALEDHLNSIDNLINLKLGCSSTHPKHPLLNSRVKCSISLPYSNEADQTGMMTPTSEQGKEEPANVHRSEIQNLCENMASRGLRKYVISHLSEVKKIREEVPEAMGLARNPGKLVLDCIGRFFLQGSKAYTKNSPMIPVREASILILEFYLLMMKRYNKSITELDQSLKEVAEMGATAWMQRLINEGGLAKISDVDGKGLLLFVSAFGIPPGFQSDDIGHLLRSCNLDEIADAIKGSHLVTSKVADAVEAMVKDGMDAEALDIIRSFGIEDKSFAQVVLNSFLRGCKRTYKKARKLAQSSPVAMKEANKSHLSTIRSLVKFVEDVGGHVPKLIGGWQINAKIAKIEKENKDLDNRIKEHATSKRKLQEAAPSAAVKSLETKKTRVPFPMPPYADGLHELHPGSGRNGAAYGWQSSGSEVSVAHMGYGPFGPTQPMSEIYGYGGGVASMDYHLQAQIPAWNSYA